MLKVSINGAPATIADSIVLYDDKIPIAACVNHSGVVFFADSVRDRSELVGILNQLGINISHMHEYAGEIKGEM